MSPLPRPLTIAPALALAATLVWRPAAADPTNRNFLPFGERAAFLGNTGITSERGDAVFYNPANLARTGHPNLSVSANVYALFDLKADPLLEIEGEEQPFNASGFMSIPSSLVSTYKIGSWSLATAVLVPEALTLKNRVSFESPSLLVTLLQDRKQESLWLGAGLARPITENLMVGISAFVAKESTTDLAFTRVSTGDDPPVVSEFTSYTDSTVFNLSVIAGLYWQVNQKLGLGLRAHVPPIKLTGGADIYQSALVPGDETLTYEQEFNDVTVSAPSPLDLGLGTSFRVTPRFELMLDVNVQMPATLVTVNEPDIPEVGVVRQELELAPRVSAGTEWEFIQKTWWLRLGLVYNKSAVPEPEVGSDELQEDFYGVTGGLAWEKDRTHTAVGGFFLRSKADLIVDGTDPPRRSDARTLLYGALLTVSYRL